MDILNYRGENIPDGEFEPLPSFNCWAVAQRAFYVQPIILRHLGQLQEHLFWSSNYFKEKQNGYRLNWRTSIYFQRFFLGWNGNKWESELFSNFAECLLCALCGLCLFVSRRQFVPATVIVLHNQEVVLGEHHDDRKVGCGRSKRPSITLFSEFQKVLVPRMQMQQSRSLTRCFNAKPIENTSVNSIADDSEKTPAYQMYLIRKLCTTLGSISKEELYGLNIFKAPTIVED